MTDIGAALCLVFLSGLQVEEFCYVPSRATPGELDIMHLRSGLLCRWNSRIFCVDLQHWD